MQYTFRSNIKDVSTKFLTKEGVSYTNRIRYSEFKSLFEKYGMKIIYNEVEKISLDNVVISKDFDINDKALNVDICKMLLLKE